MNTTESKADGQGKQPQLHLTVLVDGKPKPVNARPSDTVLDVIREALGPSRADQAGQYQLTPEGGTALDPNQTLEQAGIQDRQVLSLGKKEGGGGSR